MEACLLVVTKRGRDISKDDKITIPFEYGIFKKFLFFFSWKAREQDSFGKWCLGIPVAWSQNVFKCTVIETFFGGSEVGIWPAGTGCTVPADTCSFPRDLITTTAPPWSRRNLCNLASATAPLRAASSSRTPFVWAVLRKKDFLSSETFN